jgi:CarD family transcriptional regulator
VVYPPHGAGTVVASEQRGEEGEEYLSIRVERSKMTLMVPAAAAAEKGVRPVISSKEADRLLASLKDEGEKMPDNPQQRARHTVEQTRTGGTEELAGILRSLISRQRGGAKLSAAEMRTLTTATETLASELALSKGVEQAAAITMIEEALAAGDPPAE